LQQIAASVRLLRPLGNSQYFVFGCPLCFPKWNEPCESDPQGKNKCLHALPAPWIHPARQRALEQQPENEHLAPDMPSMKNSTGNGYFAAGWTINRLRQR
jgi:hypothetical protein